MSLREEILKAISGKCFSEIAAERATDDLLSIFKRHIEEAFDAGNLSMDWNPKEGWIINYTKSEYLKSKGIE